MKLHPTENLSNSKGNHPQNEKQPAECDKIFCKSCIWKGAPIQNGPKLILKGTKTQIKKWWKTKYFSKEYVQMANELIKTCLTSLYINQESVKNKKL